jgi:hypothetical protein
LRTAALDVGYFQDDAVQIAMLEGAYPGTYGPLDLFRFADVERHGRAGLDAGALPWWSAPDLRIAMFRPLASGLIATDHALFGIDARAAHWHSLLWLAAAIGAVALALGELFAAPVVALALLFFAVDESFTAPVGWIANRSYLVVTAFGWLGVWAHVRAYGTDRRAAMRVIEAGCFGLALAGGEYAIGMLAYPFALEAFRRRARWRERAVALLPSIVPALGYLALRRALGFGTRGSGFYLDPTASPAAFASAVLERAPTLAGMLILGDTDRLGLGSDTRAAWIAAGSAAALALVAVAWWTSRAEEPESRGAWFAMAVGALLSLAPTASAVPDGRLLVAAAGGAAAVFAGVVVTAVSRARIAVRRGAPLRALGLAAVAVGIVYVHGLDAALRSRAALDAFALRAQSEWQWAQAAQIPADAEAQVVFLSGADYTTNASLVQVRRLGGHVPPRAYWRLSPYGLPHAVQRVADDAIEVRVLQGVAQPMANSLYRSDATPLETGDTVALDGMRVSVLEARGGEPLRLRFAFDRSLDDPRLVFLHATPRGLRRIALPPVGGKLRLPPPAIPGPPT